MEGLFDWMEWLLFFMGGWFVIALIGSMFIGAFIRVGIGGDDWERADWESIHGDDRHTQDLPHDHRRAG